MRHVQVCGAFAAALVLVSLIAAGEDPRVGDPAQPRNPLAGIEAEDAFPAGCVDCHAKLQDRDVRIGPVLAELDHLPIDRRVETVPGDCGKCHAEDGDAEPLATLLHRSHYGRGAESHFIQEFGGACLHCHALDLGSGEMRVKQGPKNW